MDEQWWSIEVIDGEFSAAVWQESHRTALVEALLTNGGINWAWQRRPWGIVLEVRFQDEDAWESFRALPAVRAALDAVPDPVGGLLIYRGRGGSSGVTEPRRPRPHLGAGAAPVPEEPSPVVVVGHPDPEQVPPPFVRAAA
jgi:hypothetical protein